MYMNVGFIARSTAVNTASAEFGDSSCVWNNCIFIHKSLSTWLLRHNLYDLDKILLLGPRAKFFHFSFNSCSTNDSLPIFFLSLLRSFFYYIFSRAITTINLFFVNRLYFTAVNDSLAVWSNCDCDLAALKFPVIEKHCSASERHKNKKRLNMLIYN